MARRLDKELNEYMDRRYIDLMAMFFDDGFIYPKRTGLRCKWIEKGRRRDPDNISSFGRKVILDAGENRHPERRWMELRNGVYGRFPR